MENKNIEKLNEIINRNEPLISILQDIQSEFGYLSFDNLNYISETKDISLEEIYSVATFYNQFKLEPKGKYEISICLGTVCYVKGSDDILEEITKILGIKNGECTKDLKFSLDTTRCLGCCSMAPAIKINNDIYGFVKKEEIRNILNKYE